MQIWMLNGRETLIAAIVVLFLGKFLTLKIDYLKRNNIPEPVTGGVLAALIALALYLALDTLVEFSLENRDLLLVVFFTTIGLSSKFATLVKGGGGLMIMLVLAIVYLALQNLLGISIVTALGFEPVAGMMGGSVSLSGGHGTAIAWAPVFISEYGLDRALEAGLAFATFGLILGGLIGGPIAGFLIRRDSLSGAGGKRITVGFRHEEHERVEVDHMLMTLLAIAVSMELGYQLHEILLARDINMPAFVPCLLVAIVLTNTVPYVFKNLPFWPTGSRSLALVSDLSLGLFLAMSLMSLKLWTLAAIFGPLMIVMAAQLALVVAFCVLVVYRLMGRDYEAAVMSAGYAGFALGATPTAIVNMSAVSKQYGAAPKAFIIIPLIGAFFIDISNAFIIQLMLKLFG